MILLIPILANLAHIKFLYFISVSYRNFLLTISLISCILFISS